MRIGVLIGSDLEQLRWACKLGFRSVQWMGFDRSPAGPEQTDWKPFADSIAAQARESDLRISAVGALYANPLHPRQTESARATLLRAVDVAEHIGTNTVSGFPGAVIETDIHERGGNPVYRPFENYLPQLLAFWEPIARIAADKGIRIAFEHCPQGPYHLPVMHYNMLGQPAMWERLFNASKCQNLGIEWDASHLVCQLIDPVANIHQFGPRIFHVHAKDALINRPLLERYGICHPGVAEHRFPGLGQSNWGEIIHALLRAGYDSDLNVEGWHDPVFRDHRRPQPADVESASPDPIAGMNLEETGLLIAQRTLRQFTTDW